MLSALIARAKLFARFLAWRFRARFLCPRGKHGNNWQYFGRSRICRCCHTEEWYDPHGKPTQWRKEDHRPFAESRPSWHKTQPGILPPSNGDEEPTDGN